MSDNVVITRRQWMEGRAPEYRDDPAVVALYGTYGDAMSFEVHRRDAIDERNAADLDGSDEPDYAREREFGVDGAFFLTLMRPLRKRFFDPRLRENRLVHWCVTYGHPEWEELRFEDYSRQNYYTLDVAARISDELDLVATELVGVDRYFAGGGEDDQTLSELASEWAKPWYNGEFPVMYTAGFYRDVSARLYEMSHRLDPVRYVMSIYGP